MSPRRISEPPPETGTLRSPLAPTGSHWDAGSPERMPTVLSLLALFHKAATEMLTSKAAYQSDYV